MNYLNVLSYVLLLSVIGYGCTQSKSEVLKDEEQPLAVKVEKASLVQRNGGIIYSGDIQPSRESNANFNISGKIVLAPLEEGDFVNQGQLIASLDPADFQIERKVAEAQLMEAKDNYERFKQLYEKKSLPERDYIAAQAAYQQAKGNLEAIDKRIADTRLLSPSNGVVAEKNKEVGSTVTSADDIYKIAVLNPAYAEISIPESEIGKVKKGQEAKVIIPTLDHQTFTGKVSIIAPIANPETRTFEVKIKIDNPKYILKGGMIAEVSLDSEQLVESLNIPNQAVLKSPDHKSYVFVANMKNNKAEKRKVAVGKVLGDGVEILEGLKENEWIVTAGHHKLRDGQKIQPENKKLVSSNH